ALVGQDAGVEQRPRSLVAEAFDVEGAARRDVEDALHQLGGTRLGVGATTVLVTGLLLDQLGATGRAVGRGHPLLQSFGAQTRDGTEDLGDHVAGLAQDDGVAGAYVL